ncbi:MAG: hypothetical protein K0R29_751 [Pseudobdellovibrio sp.]|jgi:predicted dehydrogenase|nr:hypothetical protein [Pseudobdellovibrio sp.]
MGNNSKATFRVAIIGCGKIGSYWDEVSSDRAQAKTHAGAFSKNPQTEVVCFLDISADRARQAQSFWKTGIATSSMEELLATKPDIVCLCTPESERLVYLKALRALPNLVIISEKPLSVNFAEAKEILQIAKEQKGWKWIVNFIRRYSDGFQELNEFLRNDPLGEPVGANAWYGKGMRNSGSHMFDLLSMIFKIEPVSVQALSHVTDDLTDRDPSHELRLEYKNKTGNVVPVHLSVCDHRNFMFFETTMIFSKGRIRISDLGHSIEVDQVVEDTRYPQYQTLNRIHHWNNGLKSFFENMGNEAVRLAQGEKLDVKSSLSQAFSQMHILEAANESVKLHGQKITINYNDRS